MPSEAHLSSNITAVQNRFGFRLLQEHLKLQDSFPRQMENTILSPLSMSASLGMVLNGAGGKTAESIAAALGVSQTDISLLNRALIRSIEGLADIQGLEVSIANSLWVKQGVTLAADFLSTCQKYYAAQSANLDFSSSQALEVINDWVKQATQGNIPTILETISPSTILFILNAVYFKGAWANQFDPQKTRPGTFHSPGSDAIQCLFMNRSAKFAYLQNDAFKAVRLPYQDERFAMFVFLPAPRTSPDESIAVFQNNLTAENWEDWLDKFHLMDGSLSMPRIEIDCAMDLRETLAALGMGEAFDQSRADFSRMCDTAANIFISDVIHKTRLEVNEEGTVAAAATRVTMMSKSIGMRFSMVLDRPFFFAIHDRQSGALLFIGWVTKPGANSSK